MHCFFSGRLLMVNGGVAFLMVWILCYIGR